MKLMSIGAAGIACILAAVTAVIVTSDGGDASDGDRSGSGGGTPETVKIVRGNLTGETPRPGVLTYKGSRAVVSASNGTVTELRGNGKKLAIGDWLYRVDNASIILLRGRLPAWRDFGPGMSDGPDVLQLESSLRELGFFVQEPDEKFTWWTGDAIRRWQKSLGRKETPTVQRSSVVFLPGPVRVAQRLVAVGDALAAGAAVMDVTGLTKKIDIELKSGDQGLAKVGRHVRIELPGGKTAKGRITSVGSPTEKDINGVKTMVLPVVVTLDKAKAARGLERASVTVSFRSDSRKDVLFVPVDALIALPGGGTGVEVVAFGGKVRRLPVTTGLFAAGKVEVSGKELSAGLDVVVPKL